MNLPTEQTINIGGTDYRFSKFTVTHLQEFLQWAKDLLPDPFEGIAEKIKGLPDQLAKYVIDKAEARAERRGTINDPDVQVLAQTKHGLVKLVGLLFKKHQPGMTEDQITAVVEQGIAEHGEEFLAKCFPDLVRNLPR